MDLGLGRAWSFVGVRYRVRVRERTMVRMRVRVYMVYRLYDVCGVRV